MKSSAIKILSLVVITLFLWSLPVAAFGAAEQNVTTIITWEQQWEEGGEWFQVDSSNSTISAKPKDTSSVFIRIHLSKINVNEGLYISKLYGTQVQILQNEKEIYSSVRTYTYDSYRILVPLESGSPGQDILIKVKTVTDRLGAASLIKVGDYQKLEGAYVKANLNDVFLGCAFLFISLIMLLSAIFLNREQRRNWLSLSIMIMAIGVMMIAYSPFPYVFYEQWGRLFYSMFDLALFFFMPALTYFFESIFGAGYFAIFRKLRKFQIGYSTFCLICSVLHLLTHYKYFDVYFFFTVTLVGVVMIIQFLLIIIFTITYALKGNIEARILSIGMGIFAITGAGELIWFYLQAEAYDLKFWKLGMLAFTGTLIILLGRKMAATRRKMVSYSKELESYYLQIQRAEKLEVIGQLAASVAHEVRNPLQVSRGFLQLLDERVENEKVQGFIEIAIEELDRAAGIVTNYLSVATPNEDSINRLNLAKELVLVEQMILPIANKQGIQIEVDIPTHLHLDGNDAKLKQIFINLMKNSLEALGESGVIRIWAFKDEGGIVIHLLDNGEGMEENVLQRLGEPYFSNKASGTGLGLMATFRIVEMMQGRLEYKSEKGVGTEAIIRFPASS